MSSMPSSNHTQANSTVTKTKKHRKKKTAEKLDIHGGTDKLNGLNDQEHGEHDDGEAEEPETPIDASHVEAHPGEPISNGLHSPITNGFSKLPNQDNLLRGLSKQDEEPSASPLLQNESSSMPPTSNDSPKTSGLTASVEDTDARFEALATERTALRDEVAQLRRSLEEIQRKHLEELASLREQLEDTQGEKEYAETQYRNLLGKVNTIKSQLGERLKADAEDLAQARSRIEELEEQNKNLQEQNNARSAELAALAEEGEQRSRELSTLRNRNNLSQQNWLKEKQELIQREAYTREEFENAKQAMSDWEVLAMEERSIREGLADRVADLEEQVLSQREAYERAASERDSQALTVDGLQRALQEIQEARKRELRELVDNSQAQATELRKQLEEAQAAAAGSSKTLKVAQSELERALPFEAEVKEKNLLIGKLRHEAVTLNEHLTKAFRMLKKGKPEDNIDKQLVTNHFLHFLALERSDPKKFQILQIIALLLNWTDEQREQAGLARPGASNPNLRQPISPWHRTPSTPALSQDFFPDSKERKESLAGLWSDFLEREAQGEVKSSRSTSISSTMKPS